MRSFAIALSLCLTTAACSGKVSPPPPGATDPLSTTSTAKTPADAGADDASGDSVVGAATGKAACTVVAASSYDQDCVEDTRARSTRTVGSALTG
jgi:hypothetical protein